MSFYPLSSPFFLFVLRSCGISQIPTNYQRTMNSCSCFIHSMLCLFVCSLACLYTFIYLNSFCLYLNCDTFATFFIMCSTIVLLNKAFSFCWGSTGAESLIWAKIHSGGHLKVYLCHVFGIAHFVDFTLYAHIFHWPRSVLDGLFSYYIDLRFVGLDDQYSLRWNICL